MKMRKYLALLVILAVLSGCSGGGVVVSNGAPPVDTRPPSTTSTSNPQGISVGLPGGAAVVFVLGVMVADGVSWLSQKLKQSFVRTPDPADTPSP